MISGGACSPKPPSAQPGLISGLSRAAGRERSDHRGQLFLPQKPLLGAAGDVATDSGASITPLSRGCGCPPASGGIRNRRQRACWGSLRHSPAQPLPWAPGRAQHSPISVCGPHVSCRTGGTLVPTRLPPRTPEPGGPTPGAGGQATLQGSEG